MKERPILFSGSMVRAICSGKKTQTRRVMKPQPPDWCKEFGFTCFTPPGHISGRGYYHEEGPAEKFFRCPYGTPGEELWVRETWAVGPNLNVPAVYAADFSQDDDFGSIAIDFSTGESCDLKWKTSIHMPRWASRLSLSVAGVRVERLHEISEEDARSEGAKPWEWNPEQPLTSGERAGDKPYRSGFAYLWDEINDRRLNCSWVHNPWVWVVEFSPISNRAVTAA